MKKRFLSIMLALCMVLTLLPMQAGATSESENYELLLTQQADKLGLLVYSNIEDLSDSLNVIEVCELVAALIRCPLDYSSEDFPYTDGDDLDDNQRAVISALAEKGLIGGYADGGIRPYSGVTRAEMAMIIYRAIGSPEIENASNPFDDVNIAAWYGTMLTNMSALGIIPVPASGKFNPSETVTGVDALDWLVAASEYLQENDSNFKIPVLLFPVGAAVSAGSSVTLEAVLVPKQDDTVYEFSSSNEDIVQITNVNGNSMVLKGRAHGTATIIAAAGEYTAGCKIVVLPHIHSWSEIWDNDSTHHWHSCIAENCHITTASEKGSYAPHIYSNNMDATCNICGYTRTVNTGGSSSGSGTGSSSGSSSGGSGSSSSSDGSTGPSSSSPSANQSEIIFAGEQSIPVTVNYGAVEISATEEQIKDMIANSAVGSVVEIDMSSVPNATEIYLPQNVVESINGSEDVSGLSIVAKTGSIEMSSEALNTVSSALAGSQDQIVFKIDTIDIDAIPAIQKYPIANVLNSAVFIELSANVIHKDSEGKTVSTEPIREFNGNVTVTVPYELPADMNGRQIIACHIADDGTITYFHVKYENGMATFTTTHFSTFAVLESRAAAFSDVDIQAWYMPSVEYVLNSGLMNGTGSDLFDPNANLSRAMLVQILYNKNGQPAISSDTPFTDVSAGDWYFNAVTWATENGIVGGYGNGLFGPNDNITREQLAVMLWRYTGEPGSNGEISFSDAGQISDFAQTAIRWAVENGILNGKGSNILDPKGFATRAEAAQMLKNYLDN